MTSHNIFVYDDALHVTDILRRRIDRVPASTEAGDGYVLLSMTQQEIENIKEFIAKHQSLIMTSMVQEVIIGNSTITVNAYVIYSI